MSYFVTPGFWNPNGTGVVNLSEVIDKPFLIFHNNIKIKFAENLKLLKHSEVYIYFI